MIYLISLLILSVVLLAVVAVVVVYKIKVASCPMTACPMPVYEQKPQAQDRDLRVLKDPLYPPLNRTDRSTFDGVVRETENRNINVPTRSSDDTYRLVGYLINKNNDTKDAGGNSWKLMARQTDRNNADFYIIPTNKDHDVKVPLTQEVFAGGSKFRDVYGIPKEVQFVSPLLNQTSYEFVELPKSSFLDSYN